MENFELTELVWRGTCEGIRFKVGLVGTILGTWGAMSESLQGDVRLLSGYLAATAVYVMYDGMKESWNIGGQLLNYVKEELQNEPEFKKK